MIGYIITFTILILFCLSSIRILRPTERGVVETLGKYTRFANPGLNIVIPVIQRVERINITEQMVDVQPQEIITKDNLNAKTDLVVFFKVKDDENNVKKALYNVDNVKEQIVTLAQTTARNVIGDLAFKDVNSKRNELNKRLSKIMDVETSNWGIMIVRVELKEIIPPEDVQDTMNKVIKAENEKSSAIDFATARETEADGIKRAKIKEAEGDKQSQILRAEGSAKAFELVNKKFKGNAQKLKQLEVAQLSLQNNSKIILGNDSKSILKLFDINKVQ